MHSKKAPSPIIFTEFGISTDVSSVQYEKASSAIVFTVLGTVYSPDSVTGAK